MRTVILLPYHVRQQEFEIGYFRYNSKSHDASHGMFTCAPHNRATEMIVSNSSQWKSQRPKKDEGKEKGEKGGEREAEKNRD